MMRGIERAAITAAATSPDLVPKVSKKIQNALAAVETRKLMKVYFLLNLILKS